MEAYTGFAAVYDLFMDNVPYRKWCADTVKILKKYGIKNGIVADLGCGTGSLTEALSDKGFDMIGIDASEEMLEEAQRKKYESGHDILYLCQDLRSFELYGTCAAMISRCDSLNYILKTTELVRVFRLVNNYLDPDGIFLFDCNTVHKYRDILADRTFAENRENAAFIWENTYDRKRKRNEYDLTLFIREGTSDGAFTRFTETHIQRAYTLQEIKTAARAAGLIFLELLDADTMKAATEKTERYLIAMREHGKKKEI